MSWINTSASMIRKFGVVSLVIVGGGLELVIDQLPVSYHGPVRFVFCLVVLIVLIRYLHGRTEKPISSKDNK
ncbi:hypothetical protein [Aeromonas veronii]|uniref:hypothetical protein n=1 Tax=Aeromonas veronii TaxID=654 RepID=UPI0013028B27|nr:hypothetical protein [Aeromonas veronii]KAE9622555.1 hypothetical protein GO627_20735 [Aeromonas veronii]